MRVDSSLSRNQGPRSGPRCREDQVAPNATSQLGVTMGLARMTVLEWAREDGYAQRPLLEGFKPREVSQPAQTAETQAPTAAQV